MRKLTVTYVVKVVVEARDDVSTRGHWREGQRYDRREDWITEDIPPPTDEEVVRDVRRSLNEFVVEMGVSSADFQYKIARVTGGKIIRKDGAE